MNDLALEALIRTVPDFPAPGIQFRDVTSLMADSAGFALALDRLAGLAAPLKIDAIAGIDARGFIFGAALAAKMGLGFIPLRKAGKLPVETLHEDYTLEYGTARLEIDPTMVSAGQNILLLDDLIATGGTALAGANLLRRAGAKCNNALFVIDLPDLGGAAALQEAGITPQALLSYSGH